MDFIKNKYAVPAMANGGIPRYDQQGNGPIYGNVQGGLPQQHPDMGPDTVDAKLRNGEYVLRPEAVQALGGVPAVDKLNSMGGANRPEDFGSVPAPMGDVPQMGMPNAPISEVTKKDRHGGSVTFKFDTKAENNQPTSQDSNALWAMMTDGFDNIPKPQATPMANGGAVYAESGGLWGSLVSGLSNAFSPDEERQAQLQAQANRIAQRDQEIVDGNVSDSHFSYQSDTPTPPPMNAVQATPPGYIPPMDQGITIGPATKGIINGLKEESAYTPAKGTDQSLLQSSSQTTQALSKALGAQLSEAQEIDGQVAKEEEESNNVFSSIAEHEGYRDQAYQDSAGVWTIGYGRTTNPDGSPVKQGDVTSKDIEDPIFQSRVNQDKDFVINYARENDYQWSPQQVDALTSFTYNLGKGGLNELTANGSRTNDEILSKIGLYNKAGGKFVQGLQNRRDKETALFGGGQGSLSLDDMLNANENIPNNAEIPSDAVIPKGRGGFGAPKNYDTSVLDNSGGRGGFNSAVKYDTSVLEGGNTPGNFSGSNSNIPQYGDINNPRNDAYGEIPKVKPEVEFNLDDIETKAYTQQAEQEIAYLESKVNESTELSDIEYYNDLVTQKKNELDTTLTNINDAKIEDKKIANMSTLQLQIQESADAAGVPFEKIIDNQLQVLNDKKIKAEELLQSGNLSDDAKAAVNQHLKVIAKDKAEIIEASDTSFDEGDSGDSIDTGSSSTKQLGGTKITPETTKNVLAAIERETNVKGGLFTQDEKDEVDTTLDNADGDDLNLNENETNKVTEVFGNVFKDMFGSGEFGEILTRGLIMYAGARLTGMSGNKALAFAASDALNTGSAEKKALADRKAWGEEGLDPANYTAESRAKYIQSGNSADLVPVAATAEPGSTSFGDSAGYDLDLGGGIGKIGVFHNGLGEGQYVDLYGNGTLVDVNDIRSGKILSPSKKPYSVQKWNPDNSPEKQRKRYVTDVQAMLDKTGIDFSETDVYAPQVGDQIAGEVERIRISHPHLSATAIQEQVTKSLRQYTKAVQKTKGKNPPGDASYFLRANLLAIDLDKVKKFEGTNPETVINVTDGVDNLVRGQRSQAIKNGDKWNAADSEEARTEAWAQLDAAWEILQKDERKKKEWNKRADKSPIALSPYMAFTSDFFGNPNKGPASSFILANNEAIDKLTTQKLIDIQR